MVVALLLDPLLMLVLDRFKIWFMCESSQDFRLIPSLNSWPDGDFIMVLNTQSINQAVVANVIWDCLDFAYSLFNCFRPISDLIAHPIVLALTNCKSLTCRSFVEDLRDSDVRHGRHHRDLILMCSLRCVFCRLCGWPFGFSPSFFFCLLVCPRAAPVFNRINQTHVDDFGFDPWHLKWAQRHILRLFFNFLATFKSLFVRTYCVPFSLPQTYPSRNK